MEKKKFLAAIFLVAAAIIAVAVLRPGSEGLVEFVDSGYSIQERGAGQETETDEGKYMGGSDKNIVEQKAALEYEILEQTVLEVEVLGKITACPKIFTTIFLVKNVGNADAERLFSKFYNMEIIECANCNLKELMPGETTEILVTGCGFLGKRAFAEFYSVNAEKITAIVS